MKTTQELYGLDPKKFKDMLYVDVLALKEKAARANYDEANSIQFNEIGFKALTEEQAERVKEVQKDSDNAKEAIKFITMWQDEMK